MLPYILGSLLVPLHLIVTILLLKSEQNGLAKAAAFVAGLTTMRLVQGLVFGWVFVNNQAVETGEGGKHGPFVAGLLVALGIFLLVTAYKYIVKVEDPDAPPPQWMATIDEFSPAKAFAIGMGLLLIGIKFWVFTLGALGTIAEAQLGWGGSAVAFLLFILVVQSLLLGALAARLFWPRQSIALLAQVSDLLNRYNRPIVITISLIFGLMFLFQGLQSLLA